MRSLFRAFVLIVCLSASADAAAYSTDPTAPENVRDITEHLLRGGAGQIAGVDCASACADFWSAERSIPAGSRGAAIHKELFGLRSYGVSAGAEALRTLPPLRNLGLITLDPSNDRTYVVRLGSGSSAKVTRIRVPASGPLPQGVQYYRLEWENGGAIFSPPAPQDLKAGWYVFAQGRGWAETEDAANACAIRPPDGPYERYRWVDYQHACNTSMPPGGLNYLFSGTAELGPVITFPQAIEDGPGATPDLTISNGVVVPSTRAAAESIVLAALTSGRYPLLRQWYGYQLGEPGACNPEADSTCHSQDVAEVPDCTGVPYSSCVAALSAAGLSFVSRNQLVGTAIDYRFDADAVSSTYPGVGSTVATGKTIRIYVNPTEPEFSTVLANRARPNLLFDTSEYWRPLDVDAFAGEGNHLICSASGACSGLNSMSDLAGYPGGHLDINGSSSGDYHSPVPECQTGGLRDCNGGSRSSIYYRMVTPRQGYHYLDYWFFYRFNDAPSYYGMDLLGLRHEGDWEGATVAVSGDAADTFDFASFSQHGKYYSYLRDNLHCNGGGAGTCGTGEQKSGANVSVFVANRSHANYPGPCKAIEAPSVLPLDASVNCNQTGPGGTPEAGGHDGQRAWGNNATPDALKRFPEGSGDLWQFWTGKWGVQPNVASPGNQDHWNAYSTSCDDTGTCVDNEQNAPSGARAASQADNAESAQCANWFGQGVSALACEPDTLGIALGRGHLGRAGTLQAKLMSGGEAAAAPGLAQLMGRLRPGDQVEIRSPATQHVRFYVRADDGTHAMRARFDNLPLRAGERTLIHVDQGPDGPTVRAVAGLVSSKPTETAYTSIP